MRAATLLVTAALLLGSSLARADSKAECFQAVDEGQSARASGALRRARDMFARCGASDCPQILQKDCLGWFEEVSQSLPTAVFFAEDEQGRSLVDVRVWFDGELVATRLDGKAFFAERGEHRVRFERADGTSEGASSRVEMSILLIEGERNRKVAVKFEPARRTPPLAPEKAPSSGPPVTPWVVAGIGGIALGGFAFFGLSGRSDIASLERCAPSCAQVDIDAARTKYLLADVSLGVSILALGLATYLFIRGGGGERGGH